MLIVFPKKSSFHPIFHLENDVPTNENDLPTSKNDLPTNENDMPTI